MCEHVFNHDHAEKNSHTEQTFNPLAPTVVIWLQL